MADFVRYQLDNGDVVFFEADESRLVTRRSGNPEVTDAGRLGDRLRDIAKAASEVSTGLRQHLGPDQIELEFGVKISGEVNWWFFSKTKGEGSINVKVTWTAAPGKAAEAHEADQP